MNTNDPVAFLSYVRADDEHDHGRISALRARLEGEVCMHTGKPFKIFQDKKDLKWGEHWRERLDSTLLNVTFLIPIITPRYFRSSTCRDEFNKFLLREKQLGKNGLVLPIYYLEADEINNAPSEQRDAMAEVLSSRNWADWRNLRFVGLTSSVVESAISEMAATIKNAAKELEGVIAASKNIPRPQPVSAEAAVDLAKFSPDTPVVRDQFYSPSKHKEVLDCLYYSYTTKFDEEISAADLSDSSELARLKKSVKKRVRAFRVIYQERIQAATMAIQRLGLSFVPSVTIVIDNSGSMRDKKIGDIAAWAYILSEVLERCKIPIEVLGFTTRAWKGGQSRECWVQDGKPNKPGRLNDLRHIIYKEFSATAEDTFLHFGLMLREGLMKENVDGEAILWAYNRAVAHGSDRAIIVVLSDGAPVDDATLSANPGNFLEQHLRATIEWLSRIPSIELYGVGIQFDCSRYYPKGIVSERSDELGVKLLDILPQWLSGKMAKT